MRARAFTSIELLTVVAIVAVLAGIAFPVFGSVRGRAWHTVCADNLRQLGTGIVLYANDHEGWVPPATTAEFEWSHVPDIDLAAVRDSPRVLRSALATYVKSDAVWFCPADAKERQNVLWLGQRHRLTSYFFSPDAPGERPIWPPRMQLGRDPLVKPPGQEDRPLLCDAAGLPWMDSDPSSDNGGRAASNHPDTMVNAIRHDLSLSRRAARYWVGTKE